MKAPAPPSTWAASDGDGVDEAAAETAASDVAAAAVGRAGQARLHWVQCRMCIGCMAADAARQLGRVSEHKAAAAGCRSGGGLVVGLEDRDRCAAAQELVSISAPCVVLAPPIAWHSCTDARPRGIC